MKFASINNSFFKLCEDNGVAAELLFNTNRRPYLIIIKLSFRGQISNFALPFRSDISGSTPKNQYFSLPPRPTTQPGHRHGLHYIKLFPVSDAFLEKFRVDDNPYYILISSIIDRNSKTIVDACQAHLDSYVVDGKPRFSPDIDGILAILT